MSCCFSAQSDQECPTDTACINIIKEQNKLCSISDKRGQDFPLNILPTELYTVDRCTHYPLIRGGQYYGMYEGG